LTRVCVISYSSHMFFCLAIIYVFSLYYNRVLSFYISALIFCQPFKVRVFLDSCFCNQFRYHSLEPFLCLSLNFLRFCYIYIHAYWVILVGCNLQLVKHVCQFHVENLFHLHLCHLLNTPFSPKTFLNKLCPI
jgi:hypothetical protein